MFYASALFGVIAAYIAGHLLFKNRVHSQLSLARLVTVAVLLVCLPAAAQLPSVVGLALLVLILAALITFETIAYASLRRHSAEAEPGAGGCHPRSMTSCGFGPVSGNCR